MKKAAQPESVNGRQDCDGAEDRKILETIFRTIPNPVFYRDRDRRIRRCNERFRLFLDLPEERILGRTIAQLRTDTTAAAFAEVDAALASGGETRASATFALPSDGFERTFLLNVAAIDDGRGGIGGSSGTISDLSAQAESERKIAQLMRLKDAILEINNSILQAADLDRFFDIILEKVLAAIDHADVGCILLVGEDRMLRIAAVSGYSRSETKDFRVRVEDTFQWKESDSEPGETLIINDLQDFMRTRGMPDTLLKNTKGETIRSSMSAPITIGGVFYGLFNLDSSRNNVFDETDHALMEYLRSQIPIAIGMFKSVERTVFESEHDKLTGLFNRRYFESIFSVIRSKAVRYGDRFSLALFDLNGLKKVNDTLGHLAGDELIRHFAREMKERFRASDILARFGGDEFIAILFQGEEEGLSARLDEQRRLMLAQSVPFEGVALTCGFSFGIARFGADGIEYDELVAVADRRMYEDKAALKARAAEPDAPRTGTTSRD